MANAGCYLTIFIDKSIIFPSRLNFFCNANGKMCVYVIRSASKSMVNN